MLADIFGVDGESIAGLVRCVERDVVEHPLHHGLQPPRADILHRGVEVNSDLRQASVQGMLGRARASLAKDSAEWTAAVAQVLEARATFVRLRGPTDKEASEWTQALVELYAARAKAEPSAGHEAKAAEWQRIRDEGR